MHINNPFTKFSAKFEVRIMEGIEKFLLSGTYPEWLTQGEKANFRRKCKNFKVENNILYHKSSTDEEWKVVVKTKEEQQEIIQQFHVGTQGNCIGSDWVSHCLLMSINFCY